MARYLAFALILLAAPFAAASNCGNFFAHKPVTIIAAPVVAYPQVYYQAGQSLEIRAAVAKEVRAAVKSAVPAIVAELRAQLNTSQQQHGPAANVIAEHCGKCHSGGTPKGGITYDGVTELDCKHVTAALRAIAGDAMPKDHALKPEQKGEVMQALLDLERKDEP